MTTPLRTLVADDDPTLQMLLRMSLQADARFTVVGVVDDGRTALAEVARLHPDLLVLDVDLPGTDGFGVLAALPPAERPLVVVLSSNGPAVAARALAAGAVAYLDKVDVADDLAGAIHAAVEGHTLAGD